MSGIYSSKSPGGMFLPIAAIIGLVVISVVLFFILQSLIAPGLLAGTLSEPVAQPCNLGKQWILYDCKPNPLTKLGCIVPSSAGKYLTYKTVAVLNTSCLPNASGEQSGQRVISTKWQPIEAGDCITSSSLTLSTCCEYDSTCTRTATYYCKRTEQSEGGEKQCTPYYLPAPFPSYSPSVEYTESNPAVVQVPCRTNFCKS